ncbi:MAG: 4Fe-4S binding protein [Solidesulfovibrio sp. DCME]|uniref:4Fe-4S dicluster domain-containing protein n=1 Tax=Solidesulfovibrio sp. DCME TaxID=3447380 RepID=UPI003D103739
MTEPKRGQNRVVVYPDWCKGCGICVAFCPKHVLATGPDGKARVVDEDACVNCGFCEPHCPDFAIVVAPRNGNGRNGGPKPATKEAEPAGDPSPPTPADEALPAAQPSPPTPAAPDKEGQP